MFHAHDPFSRRFLKDGPTKTVLGAIKVYRDTLVAEPEKGWKMLMDADKFTARDFLLL